MDEFLNSNPNQPVYTITRLNNYIKSIFDANSTLRQVHVKAEIYDVKQSGPHLYYMLKDETSSLRGVLFFTDNTKYDIRIKNGDEVLITGSVSVYPQKGQYQIYASSIVLYGVGNLLVELEKLKQQLHKEGLFERKIPISLYPRAVGLISAKQSAAIQDMVVNLKRRYPLADIYVFDSLVQGEGAPRDLIRAFRESQKYPIDTLIIGRGGGASEDLSAFNDEMLIRTLATRKTPLISAVGHEIDTTLVDLVSDKRASTPTGAVELASVDSREILDAFNDYRNALNRSIVSKLELYTLKVKSYKDKATLREPLGYYLESFKDLSKKWSLASKDLANKLKEQGYKISDYTKMITNNILNNYYIKEKTVQLAKSKLEGLDPTNILKLGYSISLDTQGKVIKSIKQVNISDEIRTVVSDGSITSKVINEGEK